MKLPNRENAFIPPRKLGEYLLSLTHPVGRSKAEFFRGLGFDEGNIALLEQGLLAIVRDREVTDTITSSHGMKYIVEGELPTPVRGSVEIRTVWIVEPDDTRPRFITAYPAEPSI